MAKRTQTKPVQQRKSGKGYEERDAEFGRLVVIGLGLLGVMVAGLLVAWGVFKYLEHSYKTPEFPLTFTVPDRLPPTPTLQANPEVELAVLHAHEDSVLTSYGWVDSKAGITRVPIQRGIEMLLEQGVPSRPASPKRGR